MSIVSILDLLEVGFRQEQWLIMLTGKEGFNPWFVGSRIQTIFWAFDNIVASKFQSLICWKSDSDVISSVLIFSRLKCFNPWFVGSRIQTIFFFWPYFGNSGFQSLICWKSDSDYYKSNWFLLWDGVSILDLLEVGFRLIITSSPVGIGWVSILDLLEVGFRLSKTWNFYYVLTKGFNPWFVGSRIQTLSRFQIFRDWNR